MIFEFDPRKAESNIQKHKVSFEEAQAISSDPDLVILPARKRGEKRKLAIGWASRCFTASSIQSVEMPSV